MRGRREFLRTVGGGAGLVGLTRRVKAASGAPNAWFAVSTSTPSVNESVRFDASESIDGDGSIQSYEWDIEGTYDEPTGKVVEHTFQRTGERTVRLTVTDDAGNSDQAEQTLTVTNARPTADFSYEPNNPQVGATVTFDAVPSTDPDQNIQSYTWSLEDSYRSVSGETVTIQFEQEGNYEVTLVVEDSEGLEDQKTVVVPVGNARPTPSFEYTPSTPVVDEPTTFSAASSLDTDGTITSYSWYIPSRGLRGSGEEVSFTFSETGRILVELEVTDDDGVSDVHREYVTITTPTTTTQTTTAETTSATTTRTQEGDPTSTATRTPTRTSTAERPSTPTSTADPFSQSSRTALLADRLADVSPVDVGIGSALFLGAGTLVRRWRRGGGDGGPSPKEALPTWTATRARWGDSEQSFGTLADEFSTHGPPKFRPTRPTPTVEYGELTDRTHVAAWPNAGVYEAHVGDRGDPVLLVEYRADEVSDHFEEGLGLWRRLDTHENVANVLGQGTEPTLWVAMESAMGSVDDYAGTLSISQTLWSLGAIANAVHHAHTEGVLHLGLEPSHVRFLEPDSENWPVPTVAGFGLGPVGVSADEQTSPYAAPEQRALDEPVDFRTDVYRLAAVGYVLLTGRTPATTTTSGGTQVTPPSEYRDGVPTDLDDVFKRALDGDPDRRYETVLAFRSALASVSTSLAEDDSERHS